MGRKGDLQRVFLSIPKIQIDNWFGKKSPPIHHHGFLNTSATHFQTILRTFLLHMRREARTEDCTVMQTRFENACL